MCTVLHELFSHAFLLLHALSFLILLLLIQLLLLPLLLLLLLSILMVLFIIQILLVVLLIVLLPALHFRAFLSIFILLIMLQLLLLPQTVFKTTATITTVTTTSAIFLLDNDLIRMKLSPLMEKRSKLYSVHNLNITICLFQCDQHTFFGFLLANKDTGASKYIKRPSSFQKMPTLAKGSSEFKFLKTEFKLKATKGRDNSSKKVLKCIDDSAENEDEDVDDNENEVCDNNEEEDRAYGLRGWMVNEDDCFNSDNNSCSAATHLEVDVAKFEKHYHQLKNYDSKANAKLASYSGLRSFVYVFLQHRSHLNYQFDECFEENMNPETVNAVTSMTDEGNSFIHKVDTYIYLGKFTLNCILRMPLKYHLFQRFGVEHNASHQNHGKIRHNSCICCT